MSEPRASLYVLFEGRRGDRRPVMVCPRAPRSGIKVRVSVEREAFDTRQVFLLYRRGDGDMVIGASAKAQPLEELRARFGRLAASYEIAAIPLHRPELETA